MTPVPDPVGTTGPAAVLASCWCGSADVGVPVSWIRAGSTRSCGAHNCVRGCPVSEIDSFDLVYTPVAFTLDLDQIQDCRCGCGTPVPFERGTRFRPGHDAKLKSALNRAEQEGQVVLVVQASDSVEMTAAQARSVLGWG